VPGLPAPVELEALAVPSEDGRGLGNDEAGPPARPQLCDLEIRTLIRRMARENPTWGRRRIQAELRFLGYEVAGLTVAKYMRRFSPRLSAPWRTFLEAHIRD